ncbi:MAG: hypothetical protein IH609_18540 [Dehalococcoidia bacterium]|nr:hypothetical protein [Dehalococcoidia bacterium]
MKVLLVVAGVVVAGGMFLAGGLLVWSGDAGDAEGVQAPDGGGGAMATAVDPEFARWEFLRRPLAVPRDVAGGACPAGAGSLAGQGLEHWTGGEHLYIASGREGRMSYVTRAGDWAVIGGQKTAFLVTAEVAGEALVRGLSASGGHPVRFGDGPSPAEELRIGLEATEWAEGLPEGSRLYVTFIRFEAPGCYVIQVDGVDFQDVIVIDVSEGQ